MSQEVPKKPTTYQPLGTSQNEIFRPPEYEIGWVYSDTVVLSLWQQRCWWQPYIGYFILEIQKCHQHIESRISVTNIDGVRVLLGLCRESFKAAVNT